MAIVAIFSGSYCDGEIIADRTASDLGYETIEEKLMAETTRRYGIPPEKLIRALQGPEPLFNRLTRSREKSLASLKAVLSELIAADNKLLYGLTVHLIPRYISHVLKVCIIANHDYRIRSAVQKHSLSEKEARKRIYDDDNINARLTGYLFSKNPYDETLYDIVIPMQESSLGEAVATIMKHARSEQVQFTPRVRQAAQDFILSATVNLALVNAGHDVEVFSENGNVILTINKDVVRMKPYQEELSKIAGSIEGVRDVKVRIGQKFRTVSMNPWSNLEVPPKILLVDDEKEFVHTLSERLQTRNIESSVVYDGEQAIDFVNRDEPNVMVLDLMMPGIDGLEVLRRVKRDHPKVEVIILTGHGSEKEEKIAAELGAFAYLNKPVDIDVLARVMNEAYQKINLKTDQSPGEN
ncbi:MAG: response regulator [candidate division Zixibacteria bacterium]|nr:response regulator [candidate division Zixibacteria bacterium]MDD5426600.1 response regulator [candidate division Zixibacteria bacterium]